MARQKHIQQFTGGMNTVISPYLLPADSYPYMLNCDVGSTYEGKLGAIRNIKGTVEIFVDLQIGDNKTIGVVSNEETNKMYFAVWNSNSYHTWFELDYVSKTVKVVFQNITDTGGIDELKWERGSIISSANIVDDVLLYWTMKGHPARKINVTKAIEKSEDGYGHVIIDEYIRAYKRSPAFPPFAEYFTKESLRRNNLFRKLFQFATRFIYDDNEYSTFSDFSNIAVPAEENVTGTLGVPFENNGINVRFLTGGAIVKKIELVMRMTTDVANVISPWVSVGVFDKDVLGIGDDTEYVYEFYNDVTYLAIDQATVSKQQSDLPDNPLVQEVTYNSIVYGNFYEGFPPVEVNMSTNVEYSELFVPDGTEDVPNEPFMGMSGIQRSWLSGGFLSGGGWNQTRAILTVGHDVKNGNKFTLRLMETDYEKTITATLNDTAKTIASQFRTSLAGILATEPHRGGFVGDVSEAPNGSASFEFMVWNTWNKPHIYFRTEYVPVNYSTLKDTGNSVRNEKLGSSFRYAVRYENTDGKRSLAYGNNDVTEIRTLSELGDIMKVTTNLVINHKAPSWATRYSVVRTRNLSQQDYIHLLIQRVNTHSTVAGGETYHDLIIGSLFSFQRLHPNATLGYEFKQGDRVRLLKTLNQGSWVVETDVIDYEVLAYYPEARTVVNKSITTNGTSNVITDLPDSNNIGNNIVIDGHERKIQGISSNGYVLDSPINIGSGSSETRIPSFEIINRNGILRIKMDPEYPIDVNYNENKFALVEVYSPANSLLVASEENYYDIGYKFEIVHGNGEHLHRGNSQDQTSDLPAIVSIEGIDNYVRNRELITNDSVTNPQIAPMTPIEDPSYSDFYNSNISSLGRPTRLDDSRGVVHFEDRLIWSDNFIEDTRINGLNMFHSTNRVDYNDKYGAIMKILFYEGKLYVFKFLKTGWVPVLGNLLVDDSGQEFIASTTKLLPDKMGYFLWEGGVGNNPESIVKLGNDIYGVSPNSQVFFCIGGSGLIPTSEVYGIDNYARDIISKAAGSGARMYGSVSRKKNQYVLMIEPYDEVSYADQFNASNTSLIPTLYDDNWTIVTPPSSGAINIVDGVSTYTPNIGFSGIDFFSYMSESGVIRNVYINVIQG